MKSKSYLVFQSSIRNYVCDNKHKNHRQMIFYHSFSILNLCVLRDFAVNWKSKRLRSLFSVFRVLVFLWFLQNQSVPAPYPVHPADNATSVRLNEWLQIYYDAMKSKSYLIFQSSIRNYVCDNKHKIIGRWFYHSFPTLKFV